MRIALPALTTALVLAGFAQQPPARDLRVEYVPRKLALVIGNNAYPKWPLKNPANDARAVASALANLGFESEVSIDADHRAIRRTVDKFVASIRPGDTALFYYAGHGIQLDGENYLVPIDFDAKDEADARYEAYSASRVQERMENAGARLNLVILDACRNNPFRSARSGTGGLAAMNAGRGTLIAFATSPGKTADDNPAGSNGLFTSHLVAVLQEPRLTLDQVFNRVRERVYADSGRQQLPWTISSVIGEFYFNDRGGVGARPALPTEPAAVVPPSDPPAQERTAAPSAAQPPPINVKDASDAFDRGDYEHAIRLAHAALRLDSSQTGALAVLAASQFKMNQYDDYERTALQAIRLGGGVALKLGHHHTLTGFHVSELKVGAAGIVFDPLGSTQCNQKPFDTPPAQIVSAQRTTNANGEVFLNLRLRDPQNRVRTLNFVDPDSSIDTSSGFPVVRSSERALQSMNAIATLINKLKSP